MKMTTEEYLEMENSFQGFCTTCKKWTRPTTESDARDYDCPECGENTVIGAGEALIEGLLIITE